MAEMIAQFLQQSTKSSVQEDQEEAGSLITLDLRGEKIVLEREELISLPESILLCLFPNGWMINEGMNGEPVFVDVCISK